MKKYEFVAVDFDGTICANAYPEIGKPNLAVISYIKQLAEDGTKIILWTCRENGTRKLLDEAIAFCKAQEIPLYAVNENPGNPYAAKNGLNPSDGRKVYADLYIDDKALNLSNMVKPPKRELSKLADGARFQYGGVEWIKLGTTYFSGGVISISADIVFDRAFDDKGFNDWRNSTLREELNGLFLNSLVKDGGADKAAFLDWASNLAADDGMKDYGAAIDKIALLSDDMYREYRRFIPKAKKQWWTLTPLECKCTLRCLYSVRYVIPSGAMGWTHAFNCNCGVRPICHLKQETIVGQRELQAEI